MGENKSREIYSKEKGVKEKSEKNKSKKILEDFRTHEPILKLLEDVTLPILEKKLRRSGIRLQSIEHRLKTPESFIEKLNRKRDKYDELYDITDLLGIRVICFFADDVDKVADIVDGLFIVDYDHSVDPRKEISPTNFGYLSLHYVCSLPESPKYPAELCKIRFEIQMRSSLQNVWAEIEHDLGYKNDFGVPKNVQREFARVAGLLEIADKEFGEIRGKMSRYEYEVRKEIRDDKAYDMPLDLISLREFMNHSRQFTKFMQKLLDMSGMKKKIVKVSPVSYLGNLNELGVNTIGDLLTLLEEEQEHAVELFGEMLKNQELDEIVTSVGLFLLCQARIVWNGWDEKAIRRYFHKTARTDAQAERRTKRVMNLREQKGI